MRVATAAAALALAAAAGPARADGPEGEERSLGLVAALKSSAYAVKGAGDPALAPEPLAAQSLWQLRLEGEGAPAAGLRGGAAWQTVLEVDSGAGPTSAVGGVLPRAAAAYRIRPLSWPIGRPVEGLAWNHEIDRLWLSGEIGPARVTAGRQAVGWGRGVLFGAVDVFAPFGALQADREWRAGIDAVRADVSLGQRLSADVVGAFGEHADGSAVAGRLRGFVGDVDAEVVGGWRAGDVFGGLTTSGAVGPVELHLEAVLFRTPSAWPGGLGDEERLVPVGLAGVSWRAPIGNGVYVLAEVFHSTFGLERVEDVAVAIAEPAVLERFQRGDAQTLGRDTAAATLSYEANEVLTVSCTVLQSLQDGSGIAAPGVAMRLGDAIAVTATLYPSWGARPSGGLPRSFWGTNPFAGYVQVAVYGGGRRTMH